MKRTIFCWLLLGLACMVIDAQVPMKQAIKRGIEMSATCKNHELEARALELAKRSAEMKKWFSLDFSASYLYKSEQMEIVFPATPLAPGIVIPGNRIAAGAKHNADFKLGLSQPLFVGGLLSSGIKLEEVKLAVEKNRLLLGKIETAALIKGSYFNWQLLQSRLASLDSLIAQLELHRKKVAAYVREELVRKSDLLETEAKIEEQILNREDLLHQIEKERIAFKTLCGFAIEEIAPDYAETTTDFSRAFSAFKNRHPVIRSLDQKMSACRLREKIARGQYLPQVMGFAELHFGKPGIDFFANQWSLYFQGGVAFALKIFEWGKMGRDVEIIRRDTEKVENEKNDFIKQGEKRLKQLFSARSSAERKLLRVKKLVRIADEDLALKETLLQEQQIANIDFLAALSQRERYVSLQKGIETQLQLIKVSINRVVGTFEEDR